MARHRRKKLAALSRLIVSMLFFLFVLFRKPVLQYALYAAAAIWIGLEVWETIYVLRGRKKRTVQKKQPSTTKQELSGQEVFLIRQINIRITDLLKETYPGVIWLWESRPAVEAICQGGTWRICLQNADPFNYGDVTIDSRGQISIALMQIVDLQDSDQVKSAKDDLTQEELLEKPDARQWYEANGEKCLMQLIDELNTQGHKKLTIRDDGSVVVSALGERRVVDELPNFPPRLAWSQLCQLLSEDQIQASVQSDSIQLAW